MCIRPAGDWVGGGLGSWLLFGEFHSLIQDSEEVGALVDDVLRTVHVGLLKRGRVEGKEWRLCTDGQGHKMGPMNDGQVGRRLLDLVLQSKGIHSNHFVSIVMLNEQTNEQQFG